MVAFNNKLIQAIKERIPQRKDQLIFLMDTINLGKETVYRRMRGDIPFTYCEACIIANKLGISLDNLAKITSSDRPLFELEISPANPMDYIEQKLLQLEHSYEEFDHISNPIIESVISVIPYSLLLPFEHLFRFHIFKLVYQMDNKRVPQHFSEFTLSDDLNERRKKMAEKNPKTPEDTFIFDRYTFLSLIDEIKYFYTLDLIFNEEKELLKNEYIQLLSDFEFQAAQGKKGFGIKTWVYLSNISLNHSYTYVKGDDFERAYMDGIYLMDTISSSDPLICKYHKQWIESLKRYSTLISVSGERERRTFFEDQRKIANDF